MKVRIVLMPAIISLVIGMSTVVVAQNDSATTKEFDGFPSTRNEVLSQIGSATKRIRVVTDFLSDGEIVTALYIAQYRKVNVQVLLGQGRASSTLSRLNYLKAQNIPVWLRPRGFMPQHPTILLIDDKLYALNAELDSMAKHRKFTMTQQPDASVASFSDAFDTATSTGVSPTARPVPLVGRANGRSKNQNAYRPGAGGIDSARSQQNQEAQGNDDTSRSEAYRYKRVKEKPSTGIPTKLPKNTILQERARDKEARDAGE